MTIKIIDELNRKCTFFNVHIIMDTPYYLYLSFLQDRKSVMLDKCSIKSFSCDMMMNEHSLKTEN